MNSIQIWNVWNYALGVFPFVISKTDRFISFKYYSWPVFSLVLAIHLAMHYFLTSFVCGIYDNVLGAEPQQFTCYFIFVSNGFITLHRVWVTASTKRFLDSVTARLAPPAEFFPCGVRMAAANVAILVFKLLCYSQSGMFSYRIMATIVGGSALSWGPEVVLGQFSMVCYFVREELCDIERKLAAGVSVESLRQVRKRLVTGFKLFDRGLNCFKLDLFIATQLGLLFFYVTLNDIILLAFFYAAMLPLTPILIWQFMTRLGYLIGGLVDNMMYIVWLTSASTSVSSQVTSITRILYKQDVSRMDKNVQEEILLMIDQLNDSNLKVDAYGFYTLNARIIFKSFTTAMTFIFLFIQLFQLRSK